MLHIVEEGCALADETLYQQHLKEVAMALYRQPIVGVSTSVSTRPSESGLGPGSGSQEKICLRSNNSNQKLTGLLDPKTPRTTDTDPDPGTAIDVSNTDMDSAPDSPSDNSHGCNEGESEVGGGGDGLIETTGCDGKICILYDRYCSVVWSID